MYQAKFLLKLHKRTIYWPDTNIKLMTMIDAIFIQSNKLIDSFTVNVANYWSIGYADKMLVNCYSIFVFDKPERGIVVRPPLYRPNWCFIAFARRQALDAGSVSLFLCLAHKQVCVCNYCKLRQQRIRTERRVQFKSDIYVTVTMANKPTAVYRVWMSQDPAKLR